MHGPTCIVWADLTPFLAQDDRGHLAAAGCEGHARRAGVAVRPELPQGETHRVDPKFAS
jgi:hypothetical protein